MIKTKTVERFWAKVNKCGPDDCWEWCHSHVKGGYGMLKLRGKNTLAHRVSWELATGAEPGASLVCHKCDNPRCVNPQHLWLGTARDNALDREAKGRGVDNKGEGHPSARLSRAQVLAIREEYASGQCTQRDIAARYGVHFTHIGHIVRRKNWTHI